MADLGKTNAEWLRFAQEASFYWRLSRSIEEMRRRFFRERTQVINQNDVVSATPHITALTLTGIKFNSNTTADGELIVRFVANAANWDVTLHSATGGGSIVAKATNVAAGATGTLVEQNSSGVSGSLTLGATIAADTSDNHKLLILEDWKLELLDLWPSDGTTEDDTASRAAAERTLARLANRLTDALDDVRIGYEEWALSADDNKVARGNTWLREPLTSLDTEKRKAGTSGEVSRPRTGHFPSLEAAMAQETTGSTQDIAKRTVAASSGTFSSNNDGQGAVAAHTPDQRCPVGRWTFRCVQGVGNGRGGTEEFDGFFKEAEPGDFEFTFRGLRVKQSWKGPLGFGALSLTRTITKSGDGTNLNVGAASTFSTSGESEDYSDGGVLYGKTVANGSNWDIEWYSSSNRAVGDLVAKATNVATAAASAQAEPQNGSGLTVTFDVGSAPVDTTANYSIDLNFFHVENSSGVPDEFYVDVTESSAGVLSRVLAEVPIWRTQLNGEAIGSEQLDDSVVGSVNTFPARLTVDI